jgi:hypothetical protein
MQSRLQEESSSEEYSRKGLLKDCIIFTIQPCQPNCIDYYMLAQERLHRCTAVSFARED